MENNVKLDKVKNLQMLLDCFGIHKKENFSQTLNKLQRRIKCVNVINFNANCKSLFKHFVKINCELHTTFVKYSGKLDRNNKTSFRRKGKIYRLIY